MATRFTDWNEASRHPWQTRAFLLLSGGVVAMALLRLGGLGWSESAAGAVTAALLLVVFSEMLLRRPPPATKSRDHVVPYLGWSVLTLTTAVLVALFVDSIVLIPATMAIGLLSYLIVRSRR